MTEQRPLFANTVSGWRKSIPFDGIRIGVVPNLNALVALNDTAAAIWDLLADVRDPALATSAYRTNFPARSEFAEEDIGACLSLWRDQGLLAVHPAATQRHQPRDLPLTGQLSLCCALRVGETTIAVEIEDTELSEIFRILAEEVTSAKTAKTILRATGSNKRWRLFKDGICIRRADSLMLIRGLMVAEMLNTAAAALPAQAMIHGAALVRDGCGVLLTGASGAGKSTLAAVMVAKGWQLAAEDCAIFDAAMGVLPMPFALSIKSGAVSALKPYFPALETARVFHLGRRRVRYQPLAPSQRATDRVKPAMIFDVRYRPDLKPTDVLSRPLSPLETLQLFLTEESRIDFEIEGGVPFLKFVEETPAFALEFGNAETAEQAICQLLNDRKNSR